MKHAPIKQDKKSDITRKLLGLLCLTPALSGYGWLAYHWAFFWIAPIVLICFMLTIIGLDLLEIDF